MMGWLMLPMSPEKTIFFSTPFSSSHSSTLAEPSRWPASTNRSFTPGHRSTIWPYSAVVMWAATWAASSTVYRGSTGGRPARLPFWFFHWASISWMWAESWSITDISWAVRRVVTICPWNPSLISRGMRPEWSMWAWVTIT